MKIHLLLIVWFNVYKTDADLTRVQKRRCEQFISIFERGRFQLQYNYAENIHDGKGVTSGRSAFTTSTGDAYEVVRRYTLRVPDNPLATYISELKLLADHESSDISNLSGYVFAWKTAATDPIFMQIQDDVSDTIFYRPAMILADKENVRTGLGKCAFYDTVVQHGNGDDLDSISAIIRRTEQSTGGIVEANEALWVQTFLRIRRHVLVHPRDHSNKLKWRETVDRVEVFLELAEMANWPLIGPIRIDTQTFEATIL